MIVDEAAEMTEGLVEVLRSRLRAVEARVASAAVRAGRPPGSVRLVVVSKSQPVEAVAAAVRAGAGFLGENYAEEALVKMAALPESAVEWHMIGHVQSRKAERVAEHFDYVHSLDSLHLAERLARVCAGLGKILPVLLEFNVSGEESKSGLPAWFEKDWPGLEAQVEAILRLPGLQVRGLMCMPPFFDDPERTRPFFDRLRRLRDYLAGRFGTGCWDELSMGTSLDFVPAIEEGATFVRIGTAIFGPRPEK